MATMTRRATALGEPALSKAVCAQLARDLYRAGRDRVYIPPITETHPDCDLSSAYAIASAVNDLKIASGRVIKGHKIGLTSQVTRDLAGGEGPDFGTLFDDMFIQEGSSVSRSMFNRGVAVEIEIAFVLGKSVRGPNITAADVMRATDFVLPAIEIVDRRYSRRGPGPLIVDSVADGAWCGGVVLGSNPRRLTQIDVRGIAGTLLIDGETRAHGFSSAVMANPVLAVVWLANKLAEFGVALEEGHVVMSGSFTTLVPVHAESSIVASFDNLGDVTFQMSH
jgi:2-oxo-hept-3-ene-1,7-dioate hydratase